MKARDLLRITAPHSLTGILDQMPSAKIMHAYLRMPKSLGRGGSDIV